MIKNDIINGVAAAADVPRQKATQAVETVIDVMRQALARGERIELRGFGVFLVKPRKRGIGRNPKRPTEEVQIPPGFTIRFKPGKELRDMTGTLAPAPKEPAHDAHDAPAAPAAPATRT
ncbi:MAG: HU family DNA-binding protein [Acidobacteriota bacterium]